METLQDDAIKRRADEVAEWLHSVIDIPDSLFGTPRPHGESTHKIHFGIPDAFAKSIREEDYHKYYEPRVVSIGPFHHGKPHLAPMEIVKRQAVRILLEEKRNVSIEQAYATVEHDLLRIAKECYDVSRWEGISDREWCLMMFLDGCFVMVFLSDYLLYLTHGYAVGLFGIVKTHDRELVHHDLLLLENQLPFEVLRVLVGVFKSIPVSILAFSIPLVTFSAQVAFKLVGPYLDDTFSPAPVHLLQSCRDTLVGVLFKEDEEEEEEIKYHRPFSDELRTKKDLAVCPSFSVTELKKLGIRCSCKMDFRDYSLRDIHFESSILSGHLILPPLTISEWTLTLFSNLLAYEDSCSMLRKPTAISSYLNFMSMLINGEEDVKELRARGVLQLDLKVGDDQVVSFFRDMTAHTNSNHKVIRKVKQRISAYWNSTRLPLRIGYAAFKQRYFSGPWRFLVFLAVIFSVSMTVIQTVFTGIQTYK